MSEDPAKRLADDMKLRDIASKLTKYTDHELLVEIAFQLSKLNMKMDDSWAKLYDVWIALRHIEDQRRR